MNISIEDKKKEAIKRMRAMHIIRDAIKQFKEDDIVMISEPPFGGLYELNDEQKRMVKSFENEWNALVYLVVRSYTNIGILDHLFYVSNHKEEWEMDELDIADKCSCVYVINYNMPECSEFGTILWKNIGGGILRAF